MSWRTEISNTPLTIVTGDGQTYAPLWAGGQRNQDFNNTPFDFIGRVGTFLDRREARGAVYNLTLFFMGGDYLIDAKNFENSSLNKNAWLVVHPLYGEFSAQPTSLQRDDSNFNVVQFKVKVWETLPYSPPWEDIEPIEFIVSQSAEVNAEMAQSYVGQIPVLESENTADLINIVDECDARITDIIIDAADLAAFKTAVALTRDKLVKGIDTVINVIRDVQNIIHYPAEIIGSVTDRINVLNELATQLLSTGGTKDEKVTSELVGAAIVGASSEVATQGDYVSRSKVLDASEILTAQYNTIGLTNDQNTSERPDQEGAFTPDDTVQRALTELYYFTGANLQEIAFDSLLERSFVLDIDSNPVNLTFKVYGLDADDENINKFINENSLTLNELIDIRKGRIITYYA